MNGRTRITIEGTGELLHEGPTVETPLEAHARREREREKAVEAYLRENEFCELPTSYRIRVRGGIGYGYSIDLPNARPVR